RSFTLLSSLLVLAPTPLRLLVLLCSSASNFSSCLFGFQNDYEYLIVLTLVGTLYMAVGSEMVMVDQVPFAPEITVTKPLSLLGYGKSALLSTHQSLTFFDPLSLLHSCCSCDVGVTDIEIHFLQIKYNAIGVYMEKEIIQHLADWKGKKGSELAEDDVFFDAVVSASVEKYLRIVVIKEIKGSQYGVQLESAVRDRLAAIDKYEEEEEEALEKVTEFFQKKYFKKDSLITFHFPAASHTAEISFVTEGKEAAKVKVENPNVAEMIQKWYLGGTRSASPTTVKSLADNLGTMLAQ
ncbi:hypothetical protein BHE74_00031744, partial [Ensete ventricosum]